MNIRDFEYLLAIDEQKSFVKAAQKAFISQPALSQQIRKIEEELGIRIFERNRKNIITTNNGRDIIVKARAILDLHQQMKIVGKKEERINIGLIPTICSYLLPHIVDQLNSQFPKIKFYFLELKTSDLITRLESGEIDLGIMVYFKDLLDDKMIYKKLYREEFLLTLPKNSPLKERDFAKIIADKSLILLEEGNCISDNIKEICSIHGRNSFNDFYATNIETVKNMVRINNGTALLPLLACSPDDKLKFISFKSKKYREVGMIYRKNYSEHKTAQIMAEIISKTVGKIRSKVSR